MVESVNFFLGFWLANADLLYMCSDFGGLLAALTCLLLKNFHDF